MPFDLFIRGKAPEIDGPKVEQIREVLAGLECPNGDEEDVKQIAYENVLESFVNARVPGTRVYSNRTLAFIMEILKITKMGRITSAPPINAKMRMERTSDSQDLQADYHVGLAQWQAEVLTEDEGYGIPLHKLASNDGWNITERECAEASTAWESACITELPFAHQKFLDTQYWKGFMSFVRWASTHGGIRVE